MGEAFQASNGTFEFGFFCSVTVALEESTHRSSNGCTLRGSLAVNAEEANA